MSLLYCLRVIKFASRSEGAGVSNYVAQEIANFAKGPQKLLKQQLLAMLQCDSEVKLKLENTRNTYTHTTSAQPHKTTYYS